MKKKSIWPKAMLAIATGASLAASMILAPPAFAVSEQASTASDEGVYADADILQALLFAEGPAAKKLGMTELQSGEAYDTATREVTEDYLEGHAEVLAPILAELRSGEVLEVDQALQALTADFLPYLEEMPGVESPGEVQPAACGPTFCGLVLVFVIAVVGAVAVAAFAVVDVKAAGATHEQFVVRVADEIR